MYCKLDENCLQFDALGVHMLGHPYTRDLFGLDESGKQLAQKLMEGCEIDTASLGSSEQALLNALMQRNLINNTTNSRGKRVAYLHVTTRCNLNCAGCYSRSDRCNEVKERLDFNSLRKIIDNLAAANVSLVTISGGEPFLRTDILDILKYLKSEKKMKKVTCITNGTQDIDVYRQALNYVDVLYFSLDGYSRETSFLRKSVHDKALKIVTELNREGHKVAVIFTLHRKNCRMIEHMRAFAESLNLNYHFSVFSVAHSEETSEYELAEDDISFLTHHLQNERVPIADSPIQASLSCRICCGAGSSLISISANGDIMPCHMFYDKKLLMGNALEDDLSTLFEKNKKPLFHVDLKEECVKCEVKYLCGGGCLFRSYLAGNSFSKTDPLCKMYASSIEQTFDTLLDKSCERRR